MKKLLTGILVIVATVILAVFATACDGVNDPARMAEVAGTYYLSDEISSTSLSPREDKSSYTYDDSPLCLEFKTDGTIAVIDEPDRGGSWSVKDNKISMTLEGYTRTGTVEDNTLKFEFTTQSVTLGQDGNPITYNIIHSEVYIKVEA